MPYCPKCDMEFIDGITVCTDCGGPLAESKEAADAMKKLQQEEEAAQKMAEYQKILAEYQALEDAARKGPEGNILPEDLDEAGEMSAGAAVDISREAVITARSGRAPARPQVYIKKSQKYEDLKSSASAFLLVGGILTAAAILCWSNVLKLPMNQASRIISQSVITVMGLACLGVAFTSSRSARAMKGEIAQEETATRQLVNWFAENYSKDQLDARILQESGDLAFEELSLKRFDLIQDILVTSHDLPDQSYVDLLAEEIYGKVYEEV